MSAVHRLVFRLTRGRVGARVWGLSILLLTTTGRKTGRERTTPLCYLPAGDALMVVASNGGMDWFPDWWLNLQSDPHATVDVGGERRAVVARRAGPDEHARLWSELVAIAPGYLRYRDRTQREIPLVLLERA
ncbi:MAG TPA: nitroreductase/quinone reductase family protein [Gaiellaceae bacterium]|jgi:deazaflavin-dependent oxidoreductase (nitroreductase family)|nr:nitroreductase/quinone reductase family protein [Gaiellaceae bacterium]